MKQKLDKIRLKNFVDASYKKKRESRNVNGMILDNELSTRRDKVYVDPQTGRATHVIAGTDNMKDWLNNALIPFGLHHHTNRYKNSESIQKKANKKYGKENVSLITHSQSGNIAQNLQKRHLVGGENTTLNPAILGSHDKNLKVVKSSLDPVSLLTRTNKDDVILDASSYNPLTEHSTSILGSGINTEIQSILFSRPQWTLLKAKSWLKKHGYKTSVDTKKEHYRFRQTDPDNYSSFRTKHIGDDISFIIGINKDLKKKGYNDNNMKSELREQDLIDRMAKLSHDLFVHHATHGHKDSLLKAYKLIGKGIKHHMEGSGKKTGHKNIDKFNAWFKAIGQKFKPLMKFVYPVLGAASHRASEAIHDLGKSDAQLAMEELSGKPSSNYVDYHEEPKKGRNQRRREREREQQEYEYAHKDMFNQMYKPTVQQPETPGHESDYYDEEQVPESTFSAQPSSYERAWNSRYGRGVHGDGFFDDLKGGFRKFTHGADRIVHGAEDWIKHEGKNTGKRIAKVLVNKGLPKVGQYLGNLTGEYTGPLGGIIGNELGQLAKREINRKTAVGGYGVRKGKGVWKDLGKNVGQNLGLLANAGANKLVDMMGSSTEFNNNKGRGKVGKGVWRDLGKTVGQDLGLLANAGANKLVDMMGSSTEFNNGKGKVGKGVWRDLGKTVGQDLGLLANAGANKLVDMMGSSTEFNNGKGKVGKGIKRKGRFEKGSPEAKAWGEKMRQSRLSKR